MMATSKMMNGVERTAFTAAHQFVDGAVFQHAAMVGQPQKHAQGMPSKAPTTPEAPTMTMVSHSG